VRLEIQLEPDPYWDPKYQDPIYLKGLNDKAIEIKRVIAQRLDEVM